MKYNFFLPILFVLFCMSIRLPVLGQWSGKYGNEWISYENKYLKLNVQEAGLYRVLLSSLPSDFSKDLSTLQMWHKGREVSIIQIDNNELWFYAELNDGSSDSLLFRPASSRMNPYQSFFSDQGIYFLTNNKSPKRSAIINKTVLTGTPEPYSLYTEVKSLRNQFSFSTLTASPLIPNSSLYEDINTWTGSVIYGDSAVGHTSANTVSENQFTLSNYQPTQGVLPVLDIMVNGLHHGRHNVKVSVGKTSSISDQKELSVINFTGLGGVKRRGLRLSNDQFSEDKGGVISLKSNSGDIYDWFSLTYYTLTYPQKVKMAAGKSSYFNFPESVANTSRIRIETASDKAVVLDVSDPYEPKLLQGVSNDSSLEIMVPRTDKRPLKLFSTTPTQINVIGADKISQVNFRPLFTYPSSEVSSNINVPGTYDYIVITSDTLKESAIEYAKYRSSTAGGGYRTIVYDSKTIYNQFNYGEPSAVGVKRFVEYMLKDGIRDNHNLLLVGISVTAPDAGGLRLKKDLPNEVPTIGDPGADILLVSGLHGGGQDIPAIPVGRISAFNQQQVFNYLNKVKEFEADRKERSWQKKVLHLSGGKTSGEINQLSSILRSLNPLVEQGEFAGSVKTFVKQTTIETEKVDISNEVNEGVGMISYFGHGSPIITDLDMGKVSDVSRKYSNAGKYPLMYFNGCGVGNVYSGRSTITLSTDWLLSPNIGAIATIANSYNSYVSPTSKYVKFLYEELFVNGSSNVSVGRLVQNVALKVLASNPDSYDITNIHQSNLQGDPAIKLFNLTNPDYSLNRNKPIIIQSASPTNTIGTSSKLQVGVIISNNGKIVDGQYVPLNIKYNYEDGHIESVMAGFNFSSSIDTVFFNMPDSKKISKIQVYIDPDNTISETSKTNNLAELFIDWDVAGGQILYPQDAVRDVIPPVLTVTLNDRIIKNEEILESNPVLKVQLADNTYLPINTSVMEIFIKDCWSEACVYRRIDFGSDEIEAISQSSIRLNYILTDLLPGQYEMLITAKDIEGNTTKTSYNVRFAIENDIKFDITVSPNPASDFVKFEVDIEELDTVDSIIYIIYNSSGKIVQREEVKIKYAGKNIWYWFPKNNIVTGIYIYQLEIARRGNKPSRIQGKLILM